MPDEREVADHVEDLVADELVLEPQRVVEETGLAEDDGVVERAAQRQPLLAELLDLLQEAERPRRRDLLGEGLLGHVLGPRLVPQQRVVEADAVGHLEVVGRVDGDALVAVGERDRPRHLQKPPRRLEGPDARLVDQVDERGGAAVHDRHLGLVQLDADVVDAETDEGRQQMLDRPDRRRVLGERGGVADAGYPIRDGGNLQAVEIEPLETDAVVGGGGLEPKHDLPPRVETDAGARNRPAECPLGRHSGRL